MKRQNRQLFHDVWNKVMRAAEQNAALIQRLERWAEDITEETCADYAWALAEAKATEEFLCAARRFSGIGSTPAPPTR